MTRIALREFVPEHMQSTKTVNGEHTYYPVTIDETEALLNITYTTPVSNHTKEIVGKRNISRELPKYITASEQTYEVLGLLQGEMSKTNRGPLTFCNSEPELMRRALMFFRDEMLIPHNEWHWYIRINLPPFDQELNEVLAEELIEHWMNECPVVYESRYPKTLTFTKNSKRRVASNDGSLIIERRETVFVQLMHNLVKQITERMPSQDPDVIIPFLRGLFAAESCINFRQETGHRRVFVTSTKADERRIIMQCLEKLGIRASECAKIYHVIISKRNNLKRLHELGLMTLHPKKHKKFTAMLASYQ